MPYTIPRVSKSISPLLLVMLLFAASCGSEDPTATPTAGRSADPTATPTLAPSADPIATPTTTRVDTPTPGIAEGATPTVAPTDAAAFVRSTGDVDGVVFAVTEGSEATFTVQEQLASLALPNDAVMRTSELGGEVRLDGGESRVTLDLQSMTSDSSNRDRYVQSRMFPGQQTATITFGDLRPLPAGFVNGDEVLTEVTGTLSINAIEVPLTFAVEARDDGDAVVVLGRTDFTWDQLAMPVPTARSVVSVEDTVRVNVLLTLDPQPAPAG